MDVLSSLTGSGLLGGLFGAVGSGLGRLVGIYEMRERRQDRTLEMSHEKALWAHELDLQNLQVKARAAETEQVLHTIEVQGAWQGLKTSIEAETALRPGYPWVEAVRALVRPALTVLVWLTFTGLFLAALSARLPASNAIIETFVNAITFAASTALAWWFGDRSPRGVNK